MWKTFILINLTATQALKISRVTFCKIIKALQHFCLFLFSSIIQVNEISLLSVLEASSTQTSLLISSCIMQFHPTLVLFFCIIRHSLLFLVKPVSVSSSHFTKKEALHNIFFLLLKYSPSSLEDKSNYRPFLFVCPITVGTMKIYSNSPLELCYHRETFFLLLLAILH